MHAVPRIVAACAAAGVVAIAHGYDGTGLPLGNEDGRPHWRGRMSLATPLDRWHSGTAVADDAVLASPSLSLLGDYYFTASTLGANRGAGFRATSGLLIGPHSQPWIGTVPGLKRSAPGADRRLFGTPRTTLANDANELSTLPYLGLGYTGLSAHSGWKFSADLGLVSMSPGAVRLGRVTAPSPSLDDTLREMRWSPLLQLGVSYSF